MSAKFLMQARDVLAGALVCWASSAADWTGAEYPTPGTTLADVAVLSDPSGGSSGTTVNGAAGIGTIASPGVLRGTVGSAGVAALHIGGFWTLQDSGGGSVYWNASDTRADDGGTVIRPSAVVGYETDATPGRWNRLFKGQVHAEWFGARGNATHTQGVVDGTDDTAALNTARAYASTNTTVVTCSPFKAYRIDGTLSMDETDGVLFDGSGGRFKFNTSCRFKFTQARKGNTPPISMKSSRFEGLSGITIDVTCIPSTYAAADFTYANGTTRLAASRTDADLGLTAQDTDVDFSYANAATRNAVNTWTGADVGKTAVDQDTGLLWIIQSVAAGLATWNDVMQRVAQFTYTNAAARAAAAGTGWTSANLGNLARDKDTGKLWVATAIVSGAVTWTQTPHLRFQYSGTHTGAQLGPWMPEAMAIIDCGWSRVYAASPPNYSSTYCKFEKCSLIDHASTTYKVFDYGIRLSACIVCHVDDCSFTNVRYCVSGYDQTYGAGFSNKMTVYRSTFQHTIAGILDPHESWSVLDNTFECQDGAQGVLFRYSGGHGLRWNGNWHGDSAAGTYLFLYGVSGAEITGNQFGAGATYAAEFTNVHGVTYTGNYSAVPVIFDGAGSSSTGVTIGPNTYLGAGNEALGLANVLGPLWFGNGLVYGYNPTGTIGVLSVNLGTNCTASGPGAVACGSGCTASGNYALACGFICTASGNESVALGVCGEATNVGELALGGNSGGIGVAGASMLKWIALKCATSVSGSGGSVALTDALGGAFNLKNNDLICGTFIFNAADSGCTKPWSAKVEFQAKVVSSTVTVVSQTPTYTDTGTTGSTLVLSGSGLSLVATFTNNSSLAVRVGGGGWRHKLQYA